MDKMKELERLRKTEGTEKEKKGSIIVGSIIDRDGDNGREENRN